MTDLAIFAAEEFRRRRALAQQAASRGTMARAEAEAHLWPWLAIACAAGNDLARLLDLSDDASRFAYDLCEPDEWREVLAKARDAALNGNRNDEYAYGVVELATALRCRPWCPTEQAKAA